MVLRPIGQGGTRVHDVEMRRDSARQRSSASCSTRTRPACRHTPGNGRDRRMSGRRPGTPGRWFRRRRNPRPRRVPARPVRAPGARWTGRDRSNARAPAAIRRESLGVVGSAATTSIEEISGAAARTASSTASSSVTADDGQLLQLPVNARRTTAPSGPSVTSSRSTSPPCEPRYGRTRSSASDTRRCTSCGCRPCTKSRLATRSSVASRSAMPGSPQLR